MSDREVKETLLRTREALHASEEQFRLLVDSIRDYAIYMMDPAGNVVTWNTGAERIKGYTADEIIGHHFSRFYPEEDVQRGMCERELRIAKDEGRFEDEGWRVRKDGTTFWANVVITPLRDRDGDLVGFVKVTRDLTERRKAEQERLRMVEEQQAVEAASRAKDEFLALLSHELRTPLSAIVGWARVLSLPGSDERKRGRAAEVIERNAIAMAQLIDDLLDVSRIVSGKLRLDVRSVDLSPVVAAAIESMRVASDAKSIDVEQHLEEGVGTVSGDAGRLQQIVWNLLSNAVKFTPQGGRVTVRLRRADGQAEIEVADTGKGIDPRFVPQVFEPFRQAEASMTRSTGGLGLGLAIVRHLVELHGGQVEVHSEGTGRGATFTVRIPVSTPRSSQRFDLRRSASLHSSPALASLPQLVGLRVLVVEDEPDMRELLGDVLTELGCRVTTATSAADAMRCFEQGAVPDVLLSDISMPVETGYDLIRRVRALPPEKGGAVPAAALTAYTRAEDRRKVLDAGFELHVPKPVEPAELVTVLATLARSAGGG